MLKNGLIILGAGLLIAPVLAQQAREGGRMLSRECRREVIQLCGFNRGEMRECLREKKDQLSQPCKGEMMQAMAKRLRQNDTSAQTTARARTIAYGNSAAQQLDLYLPEATRPASGYPLVVFVHGGGWSKGSKDMVQQKPDFFNAKGWAFASVGYRLVPEAPVEQQAADVAAAIARLKRDSAALCIDPQRIVLMGHSAGAHLSALVGTDPQWMGPDIGALAGVILLDGAAYDVAEQMRQGSFMTKRTYEPAFGTEPQRQARLSPTLHAAAPNAPRWLILYVARRADATAQSIALARALQQGGARVQLTGMDGESHMTINRELGQPGNPQTDAVDAFLTDL
ncbi:alpha/beta hydrolase [Blastomonas sp.]|uniref:alpha/beta hydrolase n=1 Tax=Blastomonas sp. TaxID=1909299 RepID=UPI00406A276C